MAERAPTAGKRAAVKRPRVEDAGESRESPHGVTVTAAVTTTNGSTATGVSADGRPTTDESGGAAKDATPAPATRKPAATGTSAASKHAGTRSAATKPAAAKPAATKTSSTRAASATRAADTRSSPAGGDGRVKAAPKAARTPEETEQIRVALAARLDELQEEYDATVSEIAELQRGRLTDSAGDDQADTGTKTFEREQEISLANTIRERVSQVERALERLGEGGYGWCERCGNSIPVERLAAFPSATLCVTCKQLEERR